VPATPIRPFRGDFWVIDVQDRHARKKFAIRRTKIGRSGRKFAPKSRGPKQRITPGRKSAPDRPIGVPATPIRPFCGDFMRVGATAIPRQNHLARKKFRPITQQITHFRRKQ
jgi:hypothetical protein